MSDGTAWIQMTDGGNWDLAMLPRNLNIVRSAGRVLRGVHESKANLTNLSNKIDNEQIGAHFRTPSTVSTSSAAVWLCQQTFSSAPPKRGHRSPVRRNRPTPVRSLTSSWSPKRVR